MEKPNRPQHGPGAESSRSFYWRYLLWILVVTTLFLYWANTTTGPVTTESLAYTEFKEAVREGRVTEVTIEGQDIRGHYAQPEQPADEEQEPAPQPEEPGGFTTTIPSVEDPDLIPLLEQNNVTVHAESAETPWWASALIGILPWILIIALFWWGWTRMQERMGGAGGRDGMFSFGKSKARRFREGATHVRFDDVAGLENAKMDLREIIEYLRDPARYRRLGAKIPKGILLMGPPGTGKTLLAKAVAGEAGAPFYSISASEFIEMFVGVGAARVRDMFKDAKQEAPSIIFIDELDSVGRSRGTGVGGGHDEREQTLNQILAEMDGFQPHEQVVVLAATNRPDVLDRALLRPGRFDRKVVLDLPRKEARKQVLSVHTRKMPLDEDVNLDVIAQRTVGFSGADLENLVNEAALLAGRDGSETVSMAHINRARDKIILGEEREGLLNENERKLVAYHEAGHAVLAWELPEADPLDKVTIIPRGRALGATEQLPEEERHNVKFSYLKDRVAVMLGGRVAEKTVFGEVTSGAEADLAQATRLVRRMVSQWGMSEVIGPASFPRGEEHVFLGREMAQPPDFSEQTAQIIDKEIRKILEEFEKYATATLRDNRHKLDALARALLEHETIEASQVNQLFKDAEKAA
ncbi:ATP-dependent zinc metalloprotease FtsH [Thiohalomonas denitrificans]|uniref:ATP-dependent zinc metalloprotease FtsH n=1 Tax=Thiohalomonas denitrificans TaxID=415747 RepID=A0A1G5Q2R4_9GAMM|nr:ATP-dependent zinc metalloprotease FtsH [Thiohalomonas denitrificans]SCZ55589.1 cell division protease FtsH [Thiohalomonas denitrificans]